MIEENLQDDRVAEYVEPKEEPSPRLLRQMVVQNRADALSGHRRHTGQIRSLEERAYALEGKVTAHAEWHARIQEQLKRPVEASTIRFNTPTVLALLALCASIVGGQKWSTWGIQEQMAAQSAKTELLNAKMDALKQHEEDVQALQNQRAEAIQREMTRLGGQATMIDTKINNLMTGRR